MEEIICDTLTESVLVLLESPLQIYYQVWKAFKTSTQTWKRKENKGEEKYFSGLGSEYQDTNAVE